jgi:hypothetical protein
MRLLILELGKIGASSFMVAKKLLFANSTRKTITFFVLSALSQLSTAGDLYYYDGSEKRVIITDGQQWANVKDGKSVDLRVSSSVEKSGKSTSGSPVFRHGQTGAPMALPGGIIVKPKSGDTGAVAKLKAKGFEVERAIGDSGTLLVKSPEGMPTLQLANQLHESGEFESASPNWWRERRKK